MSRSGRFNGVTVPQSIRNTRMPMLLTARQNPAVTDASRPPVTIAANFANAANVTNPLPTSPGPAQPFSSDFRGVLRRRFPPTSGGSVPRKTRSKAMPKKKLHRHQVSRTDSLSHQRPTSVSRRHRRLATACDNCGEFRECSECDESHANVARPGSTFLQRFSRRFETPFSTHSGRVSPL